MIGHEAIEALEQKMLDRRREIVAFRENLQSSRENLQEPENEMEATAGKETLLDDIERQDHRLVQELRKIDRALAYIESGTYGRCDSCSRPIAAKRLRAIPWATLCKRCAQNQETGVPVQNAEEDLEEMSDEFIVTTIWDELDSKENLDVGFLEIQCDGGTIFLGGRLPTRRDHQLVMETVAEDLGFEDVVDTASIDELDQQAREPVDEEGNYEKESVLYGNPAEEDPYASADDNEPMIPPDEMMPTDDRRGG